jgi:hypothetical protein
LVGSEGIFSKEAISMTITIHPAVLTALIYLIARLAGR